MKKGLAQVILLNCAQSLLIYLYFPLLDAKKKIAVSGEGPFLLGHIDFHLVGYGSNVLHLGEH